MIFQMHQGNTKYINIIVYDKPGGTRQQLLSAISIKWQLFKEDQRCDNPVISKQLADGSIIILQDEVGDYMQIPLNPPDTDTLRGRYYYEVEVVDTLGNDETVDTGMITILERYIKAFLPMPINIINPDFITPVLGV